MWSEVGEDRCHRSVLREAELGHIGDGRWVLGVHKEDEEAYKEAYKGVDRRKGSAGSVVGRGPRCGGIDRTFRISDSL